MYNKHPISIIVSNNLFKGKQLMSLSGFTWVWGCKILGHFDPFVWSVRILFRYFDTSYCVCLHFFFSPNNCTPLCQPMQTSTYFLCSCIGGRAWHLDWTRHGINMPIQFLSHHATLSGNSPSLATAVIPAPFLWRGNEEETGDRESTGDDSHIKHNLHFWQWGHFWTAEKMAKNLNTFISL